MSHKKHLHAATRTKICSCNHSLKLPISLPHDIPIAVFVAFPGLFPSFVSGLIAIATFSPSSLWLSQGLAAQ